MFRILYSSIPPFLIPFALYWLYRRVKSVSAPAPAGALVSAGLFCVVLYLFIFADPLKSPADSTYTPPRFENGKIIPARMNHP